MNLKLASRISVVLALAVLLINAVAAGAYPAEPPETSSDAPAIIKTPCYQVLDTAEEVFTRIDIPSHRADYAAIDRIADCIHVAGVRTGRAAWATSQYLEMKDRQAERMSP